MRLRAGKRNGFTLIELLVVIAIIAVLSAMGASAYFATVNRARNNNTKTALLALDNALKSHWNAVIEEAKKEDIPAGVRAWAAPDPTGDLAKVIWIKLRLMEAFPQSFAEINSPWVYSSGLIPAGRQKYNATYKRQLGGKGIAGDDAESAACILLALSMDHGGAKKLDRDALGTAYFVDTNNDGVLEIVDGYQQPIRFFRFPTGSGDLQTTYKSASATGGTFRDPLDPQGFLFKWPSAGTNRSTFENRVHPIASGASAIYTIPVLASAGKDSRFGLGNDLSITVPADEQDNLYSYKERR
ncbi:MAG: type II secretion system protein [Gemmataceae bacterium]